MLRNAFAYVTRKRLKSLIIFLVILAMSSLSLISLSIKDATNKASEDTFGNITNSFSMEINRQVNPGTPRGGGNVKGQDIKKISKTKNIYSFVKRIIVLKYQGYIVFPVVRITLLADIFIFKQDSTTIRLV